MKLNRFTRVLPLLACLAFNARMAGADRLDTAFSYQGRLSDGGQPANGSYDLTFSVYDAWTNGTQIGVTVTNLGTTVGNGSFAVALDFGSNAFNGSARWLEIAVRTNNSFSFTVLNPRQELKPVPYALFAEGASNVVGLIPSGGLSGAYDGAVIFGNAANSFSGNGAGLTALNPSNLSPGTAAINISGNAATAISAATAGTAGTANNFSGPLAGDVTGSQAATVVASIGGLSAAQVASAVSAANDAATTNKPDTLVRRDTAGNFAAGAISAASVRGDGSGLTALNASQLVSGTLADARHSANVALLNASQTFSGSNLFSGVVQLTNTANTIVGTFSGSGSGLSSLNPAHLSVGTAEIDISGNAATATAATTAARAANFTGSLAGDVIGTQGATVVGQIHGTPISGTSPTPSQFLHFDGTQWAPANVVLDSDVIGTLSDARLSSNVAMLSGNQTFAGSNSFGGVSRFSNASNSFMGTFAGDGTGLSNLSVNAPSVFGLLAATQLSGTLPSALLAGTYGSALTLNNSANSLSGNGAGLTGVNAATLNGLGAASFWQLTGNGGTIPGVNFLGTTDQQPLELKVSNQRAFRLEPTTNSPNVIGGFSGNYSLGAIGVTIAGGGTSGAANYIRDSQIGDQNVSDFSSIGGGSGNVVWASSHSTIAGGTTNMIGNGGGRPSPDCTITGGSGNRITDSFGAVISGGRANAIFGDTMNYPDSDLCCTVGGGFDNRVAGSSGFDTSTATICGGKANDISLGSYSASIGGGEYNWVGPNNGFATIGGGSGNMIAGNGGIFGPSAATISGGQNNLIDVESAEATIAGGSGNEIGLDANGASIGGGESNLVTGVYGVIPGGIDNSATNFAFAAGTGAKAVHTGAFVWADSADADFASSAEDQVSFRCNGGARFLDTNGVGLVWAPGQTGWNYTSDRNAKEGFSRIDAQDVLKKVSALPITEWKYKGHEQKHIGPMAQDVHAAFALNESQTTLDSGDLQGIALAAIQGLNELVQEKDAKIDELEMRIRKLERVLEVKAVVPRAAARNGQ